MIPVSPPRRPRMYVHAAPVVFAAQVNLPDPQEYPAEFIAYNSVTVGAYTDIEPGMLLCLGTTPGGDDLGRQRVTYEHTNIVIRLGYTPRGTRDGELLFVHGAYITVKDSRRPWNKVPFIDIGGEMFMDGNVEVNDLNVEPPPIAVMRPAMAGTAVSGSLTVMHIADDSFAVADGATITDYAWDIKDGILLSGSLTGNFVSVAYPPGTRYASLTVTDSNGKSSTTWRMVHVDDPNDRESLQDFVIESETLTDKGKQITVRIFEPLPNADYPDGAEVLIWDKEPTGSSNRDHMLFVGWLDAKQIQLLATETGWQAGISVNLIDVGARLDQFSSYVESMSDELLRDEEIEPDTTWAYMKTPNLDKLAAFLLYWFTTVPELCDVYLSGLGEDYPFVQLQVSGGSILDQVARLASMIVPDYRLVITPLGQLKFLPDPLVIDVEDRTDEIMVELDTDEWSEASWTYQRQPKVHALWGTAQLASDSYEVVDDDLVITSVKSIAPGSTFGQGAGEQTWIEQLTQSQEDLNRITGHRYARINSRFGPMTIRVPGAIIRDGFDYTNDGWVILHLTEEQRRRVDLPSTTLRGRLLSMSSSMPSDETGLAHETSLTIEIETSGEPAYSWNVETGTATPGDGDYELPEIPTPPAPLTPPDSGLIEGQELLAAIGLDGYVYRTADFQTPDGSGGPTYTRHSLSITEELFSWVVDPFSPGYTVGIGAINSFLATENAIYKVADLFGTITKTTLLTFPTVADAGSLHWRSLQATFGAFFESHNPWLLCISYYGNTVGHAGTWATYSLDGGGSWATEVQISAYTPQDALTRFNPIGVYTSPKTPGVAYTAAFGAPILSDPALRPIWGLSTGAGNYSQVNSHQASGSILAQNNTKNLYFMPHPPADAVRIVIKGFYSIEAHKASFGNPNIHFFVNGVTGANVVVISSSFGSNQGGSTGGVNGSNPGWADDFEVTMTLTAGNWPFDKTEVGITPPTGPVGPRFQLNGISSDTGTASGEVSMRIVEIELSDGTIYNPALDGADGYISVNYGDDWTALVGDPIAPGQGLAGSIHVPWEDNDDETIVYYGNYVLDTTRQFRLMRSTGGVPTDISPDDGSRLYGVNRFGFAIRAYDSDRTNLLASVTGNDTSDDPADDYHAVYVSGNEGSSWNQVMAPIPDSQAPTNRPAFEAAFGGDSEQVIYIWGPPNGIWYSDDFGLTVDDRSGNLDALGSSGGFIGIAGGPG